MQEWEELLVEHMAIIKAITKTSGQRQGSATKIYIPLPWSPNLFTQGGGKSGT